MRDLPQTNIDKEGDGITHFYLALELFAHRAGYAICATFSTILILIVVLWGFLCWWWSWWLVSGVWATFVGGRDVLLGGMLVGLVD